MAFKISKEFKIGLFGLFSIVILYMGFHYLKGQDFFKNIKKYYVVYENIDGLTVSNSVFVKGLSVGRVGDITFQQKEGRIIVELDLDGDLILADSTVAYLRSESFLGGKAIELRIPDNLNKPHHAGDTLQSAVAMGILESITQKTLPVANDASTLLRKVGAVLDSFQTTEIHIKASVIELHNTILSTNALISENRKSLRASLDNIDKITSNLKQATADLKPLLEGANGVIDSIQAANLAQTMAGIRESVGQLKLTLSNLNEGQGTMGKLLHDDSLYNRLNRSSADLDSLLVDLRNHPKRYVHFSIFGKKD